MSDFENVRVIANSNNKNFETVNIIASAQLPSQHKGKVPRHAQITSGQAAANKGIFKTVQDSGGTNPKFRTIHIPGYSAPN